MKTNRQFPSHTIESAPAAARPLLAQTRESFGFVPSPMARMATEPALPAAFVYLSGVFDRTTLGNLEREVIIMTVARENRCGYCVAMHTALLTRSGVSPAILAALRDGTPLEDARLNALATFTLALLRGHGDVPADVWQRFREAGFDHVAGLDVVLGVTAYTLSTFANRLTQAPLDVAFESFRGENLD
jgi:uncharacterized peroxidase-related enzyme